MRKTYYGRVTYTADGLPLSFYPVNGVHYRLRDLQAVEHEFEEGRLSPEDLQRSREAWARYYERMTERAN